MSASQSAAASSLAGFIPEFTPASITSMSRGAPSESAFPAFGSDLEGFPSSSSTKSQNGNGNGAASVRRRQSERTSRAASEAAQGSEGEEDAYMDPIGQKQSQSSGQQKPKRKKATRACHACQKAHLTCDDGELYCCLAGKEKPASL